MLPRLAAVALLLVVVTPAASVAAPITYVLTGVFDTVNFPESGSGPFDHREFTITWTVPDPSDPLFPFTTLYLVNASLSIDGIGAFEQTVAWSLSIFGTSYSLGGFSDILSSGDSLFFGICSGGACNDPILYNRDPFNPVLFTGTFPLGLDSSCAFDSPCLNAQANYFGDVSYSTRYTGSLVATAADVPEPATVLVLATGAVAVASRRRRLRRLE